MDMHEKVLDVLSWLFLAFAAVVLLLTMAAEEDKPYCPTEDSCTVDHYDGEYHIVEVTP